MNRPIGGHQRFNLNNKNKTLGHSNIDHNKHKAYYKMQNDGENIINSSNREHLLEINRDPLPMYVASSYNPFKIPPNLNVSFLHRECTQFGIPIVPSQKCPCCNEPQKKMLQFKSKLREIYDVNEPVGYYFTYVWVMIIGLLFMLVFNGVYSFVQIAKDCQDVGSCQHVYGIPISKIQVFYTIPFFVLNFMVIVFLYILIGYLYYTNSFVHERLLLRHKKASDLHVMVSGMDHETISGGLLRQQIQGVDDIIYTHRIANYLQRLQQKHQLQALKQKYFKEGNYKKQQDVQVKIKKIDDKLLEVKNLFTIGQQMKLRTDKIIIKFATCEQKFEFQSKYKVSLTKTIYYTFRGKSPLNINGVNLYIQRLGDPKEIIWENLEVSSIVRYLRIFASNMGMLAFLFVSFVIVVFLSKIQKNSDNSSDILLAFAVSIGIQATNFMLDLFIDFTTEWQKRYTVTGITSAKVIKKCIAFFLNTTMIPFSMFLLNFFSPDADDLIRNILTIFLITNLVSTFLSLYLQPLWLYKLYMRYKITKQGSDCLTTQSKANDIFEKISFNVDQRYSLTCQKIMNCMFYAAIFPTGIVITMIGLIINYFIAKKWLVEYCSIPAHSFRLGKLINGITAIYPCIYAFGYAANLYTYGQVAQFDPIVSVGIACSTLPISLIFILFGNQIASYFVKKSDDLRTSKMHEYEEVTYKQLNPTSYLHKGLSQTIDKVEGTNIWKQLISYSILRQTGAMRRQSYSSSSTERYRDRLTIQRVSEMGSIKSK